MLNGPSPTATLRAVKIRPAPVSSTASAPAASERGRPQADWSINRAAPAASTWARIGSGKAASTLLRAVALGRGETPTGDESLHVRLGDAPEQLRRAAKEAQVSWSDDTRLAATVTMSWGETYTGFTLVDMYLAELATHTWDLAAATDQLGRLDSDLAATALDGLVGPSRTHGNRRIRRTCRSDPSPCHACSPATDTQPRRSVARARGRGPGPVPSIRMTSRPRGTSSPRHTATSGLNPRGHRVVRTE